MNNEEAEIVMMESRTGPRSALAGSGVEIWEIVATWKEGGECWETLVGAYPELSPRQLRAALDHYGRTPGEIDERLSLEAAWTPERVAAELPFSRLRR